MIRMSLAEIATAVDGQLVGGDPTTAVTSPPEFDSRSLQPGGLFVAVVGERDGHDFAPDAMRAGAVAVLGQRPLPTTPTIVVDDSTVALGRLANHLLSRLPKLKVVALTGSSGKTSTKDLIARVLAAVGPTVANPGTLNNELGHPRTVLETDEGTEFLVLECGARGIGHVRYLCGIAPPDLGLVLNVGAAHLGEFGSPEAIAQAKGELVEAVQPGGVAILNADDPNVSAMASRTAQRVITFGEAEGATIRATDVDLDDRGRATYTLTTPIGSTQIALAVFGAHQVSNSLAAAAVGLECGADLSVIKDTLGHATIDSERRMDVFDRTDGVTVIDDSYNANPSSTAAALRALQAIGQGQRRTWAVLGYLAELGEHEVAEHQEIGRLAATLGIDRVIAVGEGAPIADGARATGNKAEAVSDQEEAISMLRAEVTTGDVVLVKGSRYRVWKVADAMREAIMRPSADAMREAIGKPGADALREAIIRPSADAMREEDTA